MMLKWGGGDAAGGVNSRHSRRNSPFAGQLTPPPTRPLTSDTDPACQLLLLRTGFVVL